MFSYFLRLFMVWLKGGPKITSFDQEFKTQLRSWITDIDGNFHVNTARYFVYMEVARTELSLRSGLLRFIKKHRWAPLVLSTKITFRREIKPFLKVEIRTKVLGFDPRFIYFQQQIVSKAGIHSHGYVCVALYKNGQFYPPETLLQELSVSFTNNPLPKDVQLWMEGNRMVLDQIK